MEKIEKLNLKRFRAEGIDYDLNNPKKRYKQLIADLRYLANSGYPRLKAGKKWGDWKLEDVLKYFAKIVDTLRGIYFPILPPKKGTEKYNSSYWKCYREAEKYMKSKPPKTEEKRKEWDKKRKEILKILVPSDIPELLKPGRVILQPAKILVEPHGDWAISGKKKAIVTAKKYEKYLEQPVYLVQGNYCLGTIEISKPVKIDLEAFRKLRKYHLVSEKERKKWWPKARTFYFYKISVIQRFRPPREIVRPKGAQTWLETVTFKKIDLQPISPSILTDEKLKNIKDFLHTNYEKGIPNWSREDILNYYILLIREMKKRGMKIEEKQDKLEEDSKEILEALTKTGTLTLKFFGTKGLIEEENENHKYHSSLLLTFGKEKLLIDWGQINSGNLEDIKPTYILNTHAHPDHIGGLNDMEVYVSEVTSKVLPNLYKDFNIVQHVYSSYETFNLGSFKITAIPVYHSIKAPMHVFLIEVGNFRFLYTPDILSWRKGDREKYLKNLDLAIIDGSSFSKDLIRRKGGEIFGHASIRNQLKWYEGKVQKILITHVGKEIVESKDEVFERKCKTLTPIPVEIVKDNQEIKIAIKALAPVYPSGRIEGKEITLKEVLPEIKSFYPYRVFAWLVGGLVNWGKTKGDIDVLWRISPQMPSYFKHILKFRFGRQFKNRELAERVEHHWDAFHGPFTKAIPIYSLLVKRINPEGRVFEAEEIFPERKVVNLEWDEKREGFVPPDFDFELEKQRAASEEIKRQAKASRDEDKVRLFRYFLPLKPVRGYFPEKRQTIEMFLSLFKDEDFPVYSSKKYDGMNFEIHKDGEKVKFISEDGEDNTDRLPNCVKAVQNLNIDKCVLLAEVELWEKGKHLPREAITGLMHEKGKPDDSGVVVNVYDIVYYGDKPGDIHKLPFEERLKYLNKLNFSQSTWKVPDVSKKLNKAPYIKSKNREELRKHTEMLRRLPGSEGNVAKKHDFIYRLDGLRSGMIKFHNSTVVYAKVTRVKETKVKGVFNYYFGLLPDKGMKMKDLVEVENEFYHQSGRTFSTSLVARVGDVLEIECETLNIEHHLPEDEYKVTLWAPRVMRKVKRKVDTISEAKARAKKDLVLMEKEVTKDKVIYKMRIEKQDPYLVFPDESKTYRYAVQHHFRGRTVHCDLRIEGPEKDHLIGWTITDQIRGKIKSPVRSIKEAWTWEKKGVSKINWETGKPILRPGIKPGYKEKYAELVAVRKSPEPTEWLYVEGVVKPGQVGATKEYPGVFIIIDKGICEYGAQKAYFHEYFFNSKKKGLQGRYIFRQLRPAEFRGLKKIVLTDNEERYLVSLSLYRKLQKEWGEFKEILFLDEKLEPKELELEDKILPPVKETPFREETAWFFIKPVDETPYVISDRAVETGWIPPKGVSCLPRKIREKIPKEFQYWLKDSPEERRKIRDQYVKNLKVSKSITSAKSWARAALRYALSQQQKTIWWELTPGEKLARIWRNFEDFTLKHPLKEEWKKEAVDYLKKQGSEIALYLIEAILRPPLQVKPKEKVLKRSVPFVLQWHWWRGPEVVRAGPSAEHWDLRFDFKERKGLLHFVLEEDPLKAKEVTAVLKPCKYKEWMNVEGYLPPKKERDKMKEEERKKLPPGIEEANPTKDTPAYIKILDKGSAVVFEDKENFKKFQFKGKKLSGLWVFQREDQSVFWIMKKSELPKPKT